MISPEAQALAERVAEAFHGEGNAWRTAEGVAADTCLPLSTVTACLEGDSQRFRRSQMSLGGVPFYTLSLKPPPARSAEPSTELPQDSPVRPTASTPNPAPAAAGSSHEALRLVEQLEELADRSHRLPLNLVAGFDEEQFTYLVVKLRAELQEWLLSAGSPTEPVLQVRADMAVERIRAAEKSRPTPIDSVALPPTVAARPVSYAPEPDAAPTAGVDTSASPKRPKHREAATLPAQPNPGPPAPLSEPAPVAAAAAAPSESAIPSDCGPETVAAARGALRRGDHQAAIEALQGAANGEALELLGIAQELAGDRDGALSSLLASVEVEPARASAHFNRAVILAKEARLAEAAACVESALRLRPDYPAAEELERSLSARLTAAGT